MFISSQYGEETALLAVRLNESAEVHVSPWADMAHSCAENM